LGEGMLAKGDVHRLQGLPYLGFPAGTARVSHVVLPIDQREQGLFRPLSRIVKIFEPTFLLEVTPPTIAGLQLVFRPPVTDTHRQYGR
jgi:hypothetical protein